MKKFMTLILILVFSLSSVFYTSTFFIEESTSKLSNSLIHQQIEKQIFKITDDINSIIPIIENQQVLELVEKIEEDPRVSETVDRYAQLFISDLVSDEASLAKSINEDVQGVLYSYSNEFSDMMGDVINPDYKDRILQSVIERVDFSDYYSDLVNKVESRLSEKEVRILKSIDFYYKNLDTIRTTTLFLTLASFIVALLVNLSLVGMLGVLASQLLTSLVGHLLVHGIFKVVFERYLSAYNLNISYDLFIKVEIFLALGFVVALVLKKKVGKPRQ